MSLEREPLNREAFKKIIPCFKDIFPPAIDGNIVTGILKVEKKPREF